MQEWHIPRTGDGPPTMTDRNTGYCDIIVWGLCFQVMCCWVSGNKKIQTITTYLLFIDVYS